MDKKTDNRNPFKSLGVGYAHYLRNGAGAHKDRKKESSKKQCRDKNEGFRLEVFIFFMCERRQNVYSYNFRRLTIQQKCYTLNIEPRFNLSEEIICE